MVLDPWQKVKNYVHNLLNPWSRILRFIWSKQNTALAKWSGPCSFSSFGTEWHCSVHPTIRSPESSPYLRWSRLKPWRLRYVSYSCGECITFQWREGRYPPWLLLERGTCHIWFHQLLSPSSPLFGVLSECLWSHFPGTAAPIEPRYTSSLLLLASFTGMS